MGARFARAGTKTATNATGFVGPARIGPRIVGYPPETPPGTVHWWRAGWGCPGRTAPTHGTWPEPAGAVSEGGGPNLAVSGGEAGDGGGGGAAAVRTLSVKCSVGSPVARIWRRLGGN